METPWARHPFGRHLLETLLDHYSQISDVQTLAMLCSVFKAQAPPPDSYALFGHHASRACVFPPHHARYPSYTSSSVTSGSCSSTSDSITTTTWNPGRDSEHANPWGESSPDDYRYVNQGYTDPREREREQHMPLCNLPPPSKHLHLHHQRPGTNPDPRRDSTPSDWTHPGEQLRITTRMSLDWEGPTDTAEHMKSIQKHLRLDS
ncbi:GATOR complex protein WDR59-like [Neolamprologus brichardi]|uniref:GATOR complex protein WDR59-like n=1 Tax=Neolamprologus brichardi TaxID=32507 RepID=UPI001643CEF4|nr:GATOR complex protein WDR59-like [Neolamprologus brichardi]